MFWFGFWRGFGWPTRIPSRGIRFRKIATILARVFLMGIGEVVDGNEESLGVARKEKIEEDDRRDDRSQQPVDGRVDGEIQGQIDDDTQDASRAVIDDPGRGKKVTRLSLVGIPAARASIQRRKPVT